MTQLEDRLETALRHAASAIQPSIDGAHRVRRYLQRRQRRQRIFTTISVCTAVVIATIGVADYSRHVLRGRGLLNTDQPLSVQWNAVGPGGTMPDGSTVDSLASFGGTVFAAGQYFPGAHKSAIDACPKACEPVVWALGQGNRWRL